MTIDIIKIFPPIGIARLGNSPSDWPDDRDDKGEFFVGPELPGDHTIPSGGYKDSKFRVKRQAARFRLFAYEAGVVKQEITLVDADIKWTVELANTKADWHKFGGVENTNLPLRNASEPDRASLRITPGKSTLDGPNLKVAFDTGTFRSVIVPLGEMRTDADGHLLVLGGFGNSSSSPFRHLGSNSDDNFANNDDWYDDVSDGPVNASVRLKGTNAWIEASPAWVICAPPKFAPPIEHIISLYDTLLQVAVDRLNVVSLLPAEPLSFTKDIYPLLERAMNMKWVSSPAGAMHPKIQKSLPLPGSDTEPQKTARKAIFNRLRDPSTDPHEPSRVVPRKDMPKIWSDVYDTANTVTEALTKTQYHIMQQWRDGNFVNDWNGPPAPETRITPEGLTQAALESCVGGPFFPGIETSFMTRDTYAFVEAFRLDAARLSPGDLTKQMAVPWQSDFLDCAYDAGLQWWPAQRPDDVFSIDGHQVPWIRNEDNIHNAEDFIQNWHKLGFVIKQDDQYVETERHA
jgi:hypothetical protein